MALARNIFAVAMLLVVWISLRPFASNPNDAEGFGSTGGDLINQIGFGLTGGIAILCLLSLVSRPVLAGLFRPSFVGVIVVLSLSIVESPSPDETFRAVIFTMIVIVAAAAIMALPQSPNQMAGIFAAAIVATISICLFAVFFVPDQGLHSAAGAESQHSGLWRGIYDHKNVASAVMGIFAMFGLFIMRQSLMMIGAGIFVLSIIFIVFSGSKTALALLPIAFILATAAGATRSTIAKYFICLAPLVILLTITIGSAISPQINEVLQSIAPGTTFTGRLDLWQFSTARILEQPLLGYGFESFWGTSLVKGIEQPIELSWDVRGIVHAHNSYLDTAINFGIPGAIVVIATLIILPVRDFVRSQHHGVSGQMANLFLMIWIFCVLDACLESFFLRRADPVWFCMILAIFGLRLLAAMNPEGKQQS